MAKKKTAPENTNPPPPESHVGFWKQLVALLPKLRTKLQLTGLLFIVGGYIATRVVVPEQVHAQLAAGAIGIPFLLFGLLLQRLKDVPEPERAKLIIMLFVVFCVFVLGLAGLTGYFLVRSHPNSAGVSRPQEPIRDISVSVLAKVPNIAGLDAYRKRLEAEIKSLSKQAGLDEREARISAFDTKGQPAGVSIPPSSTLFPNPNTEPQVFAQTCNMFVWVWVFKDTAKIERRLSQGEGDLRFMVIYDPFVIKQKPTNYHLEGPLLNYDIATKEFVFMSGTKKLPPEAWTRTEKVATLRDLLGATLVVQVASQPPQPLGAPPADPASFLRDLPLDSLSMRVSNQEFFFDGKDFERRIVESFVYNVLKLPDNEAEFAKFSDLRR